MQIATLLLLTKVSHISLKSGSTLFHSDALGLLTFPLEVPKPLAFTLLLARVDINYIRAVSCCLLRNCSYQTPPAPGYVHLVQPIRRWHAMPFSWQKCSVPTLKASLCLVGDVRSTGRNLDWLYGVLPSLLHMKRKERTGIVCLNFCHTSFFFSFFPI